MANAHISKLRIYPIKSLDPVEVQEAVVGVHSLVNDRVFAMVDKAGRYVNGKRTHLVNQLKAVYDLPNGLVWLSDQAGNEPTSFQLEAGNAALDKYLSGFFNIDLNLIHSSKGDFLDIPVDSSLTVVSEASLQSLQEDLGQYSLENLRLRFRTNVEVAGVPAYWEERLYQEPGVGMHFRMGEVEMVGLSPRARCNVPPQDPGTGELDHSFVRNMVKSRNNSMYEDNNLLEYGRTAYFLTVNVYLPESESGKKIRLNDEIEIIEPVKIG